MKRTLFDEEDDAVGDGETSLKANPTYAKKYEEKKKKEELALLEAKYAGDGDGDEDDEEDDEEEEDDAGKLDREDWQESFLRVMPMLRGRAPEVYDKEKRFFSEQEAAKKAFAEAADADADADADAEAKATTGDGDESGLFTMKAKTAEEIADEEAKAKEWQAKRSAEKGAATKRETVPGGSGGGSDEVLMRYWKEDRELDEGEKFLRQYIWKRMWLEDDERAAAEEHELEEERGEAGADAHDAAEADDDAELEREEAFEHKYNFRFEEENGGEIAQHPRNVESERVDPRKERRAEKRREHKERKEREKLEKQEEIRRLKSLQRERITERLAQIKAATGLAELPFDEKALDEDFEPEKWSKVVEGEVFGEKFYAVEEPKVDVEADGEDDDETAKPVFEPDEFLDSTEPIGKEQLEIAKAAAGMAPAVDGPLAKALESGGALVGKRLKKKQKKQQQLAGEEGKDAEALKKEASELVDQLYGLDFEDVIGDIPCRFKYTAVEPDRTGMTVEDVLTADDELLNKVMPIKRLAPYIPPEKASAVNRPVKWMPWRSEWKKGRSAALKEAIAEGGVSANKVAAAAKRKSASRAKPKRTLTMTEGKSV